MCIALKESIPNICMSDLSELPNDTKQLEKMIDPSFTQLLDI